MSDEPRVVYATLAEPSDRGCVLVAFQFLDNRLAALLRERFVIDSGIHEKDLDKLFRGPAATLATFSARADLAYALGLISAQTWGALDWMREIRNEFAHTAGPVQLTDKKVEKLLQHLLGLTKDTTPGLMEGMAWPTVKSHLARVADYSVERWSFMTAASMLDGTLIRAKCELSKAVE